MKLEEAKSIFAVAGVPVLAHWELVNLDYKANAWCDDDQVLNHPHWLFKTPIGLIRVGPVNTDERIANFVTEVDWSDTCLRSHSDDNRTRMRAWTTKQASECLAALWAHAKTEPQPNAGDAP